MRLPALILMTAVVGLALMPVPASAATTHTVLVSSFEYSDPVLVVAAGDTVEWILQDTCHSVTEGPAGGPIPGGFDSGTYCVGSDNNGDGNTNADDLQIASMVFPSGKVFQYHCKVQMHALLGMQGVVVAL